MTFTNPVPTPPTGRRTWTRGGIVVGALGLLAGGVAAGAIVASTTGATAATNATTTAAATTAAAPDNDGDHHAGRGLSLSGTVTAVGTNSVTIKTGTATTTYGVNANSDIDKNGEAQLSDLVVGDTVTFSSDTVNGAAVIDKLHSGDEAKNKPTTDPAPTSTTTG